MHSKFMTNFKEGCWIGTLYCFVLLECLDTLEGNFSSDIDQIILLFANFFFTRLSKNTEKFHRRPKTFALFHTQKHQLRSFKNVLLMKNRMFEVWNGQIVQTVPGSCKVDSSNTISRNFLGLFFFNFSRKTDGKYDFQAQVPYALQQVTIV